VPNNIFHGVSLFR